MGREVFLASFHPLLWYKLLFTPTPPSSVPDGVDRGLEWQAPPPPSPPPIFPTHSASLALHLLGLNGSWECCDVMHWCMERTAFLCFFFFPHPLAVPQILHLYPTIFHFTLVCLQHPSCLSQVFPKPLHRGQRGQSGRCVARLCAGCEGGRRDPQHTTVSNLFMGRDLERACTARLFCVKRPILTAAI